MYTFFKSIYYLLPCKLWFFKILRLLYNPSTVVAGYLKFKGDFRLGIDPQHSVKIYNDHSTLPSLLFWHGLNGYESKTSKIWMELCSKSICAFDIGANFGLFGMLGLGINPKMKMVFFEPLERNVKRIIKNLELNKFKANIEKVAVGHRDGEVTFYDMDSSENTIGSLHKNFIESHEHHTKILPIQVPIITLDKYIQDNNIDQLDLVKIDVEGAEIEALSGFKNSINRFKPTILIEISNSKNAEKINELLTTLSFQYFIYKIDETDGLELLNILSKEENRNYLLSPKALSL